MRIMRSVPFGELLADFRKRRHMSQSKLAEELGLHRNTISLWERGEYLPEMLTCIWELAHILYLSEEELQQLFQARLGTTTIRFLADAFIPVFAALRERSAAAFDFLRLCAVLAPEFVPDELIMQGAIFLGPHLQSISTDALLWNEIIEVLRTYSLIQYCHETRSLLISLPVQFLLLHDMAEDEVTLWIDRALQALNVTLLYPAIEPSLAQQQLYYTHIDACTTLMMQRKLSRPAGVQLLLCVGYLLLKSSAFKQAELFLTRAFELVKMYDSEGPDLYLQALYCFIQLAYAQQ
jgi:DNA-binding XRE family transcriptional regulator